MMSQAKQYDILIAGGGVVGCAAAIALAKHSDYRICVVEAFVEPTASQAARAEAISSQIVHPSFDARMVALAYESLQILTSFGVEIENISACPIEKIHVSDKGHIGQTVLQTPAYKPAMGYVVALEQLGRQLQKQVLTHPNIHYMAPYQVSKATRGIHDLSLSLQGAANSKPRPNSDAHTNTDSDTVNVSAKLLLIAEGANSATRELLSIDASRDDYEQCAIIANVQSQLPHMHCAYERFTSQGPLALLPMYTSSAAHTDKSLERSLSLVWTCKPDKAQAILSLSDEDFLAELQRIYGDKLGRFETSSARHMYPLSLVTSAHYASHRTLCIGNAAQSLHPIAGQGFNLGIRDIQALLSTIKGEDAGVFANTHAYQQARKQDKQAIIQATDSLVRIFSNQYAPLVLGRNAALCGLNHLPNTKNALARYAMGAR